MPDKLDILVVDDHVVVREGLKRILQEDGHCTVAAEAANVAEALAWLRKRAFDLVLLDISLPERTGLDLLKTIKHEQPRLYRARILEKTGLVSNAELTRYMVENNPLG